MSDLYSPDSANNPAQITFPEDGDALDAASYRVGGEALADTCENIQNGTCTFTGNKTFTGNVTMQTGVLNLLNPTTNIVATGWQFNGTDPSYTRPVECPSYDSTSGAIKFPFNTTVGFGETHRFDIQGLPNGCLLVSINVRIDCANDADPTTRFRIVLRRSPLDGSGGSTVVATVEDPATGAAYQAAHLFTATFNHTIDLETYSYHFHVVGESGGDEDNVTLLAPPTITFSPPGPDWARG